jgi:hypothetical protein
MKNGMPTASGAPKITVPPAMMMTIATAASTRSRISCAASSRDGCTGMVEMRWSQPISRSRTSVLGREIAMAMNEMTMTVGM